MDITAIVKAILAPQEGQASAADWSRLEPGDQLSGRVLKLENDGRMLIDLGGSRAQAQSNVPVKPGQVLQLEVVKTGVPLHLRVLTQDSESVPRPVPQMDLEGLFSREEQQRITGLLSRILTRDQNAPVQGKMPQTVREAALSLKTAFESLSVEKESGEIASDLRTRMEDRGLFFEKKLADAVLVRSAPQDAPDARGSAPPLSRHQTQGREPTPQAAQGSGQTGTDNGHGAPPDRAAEAAATKPSPPAATPGSPAAGEQQQAAPPPLVGAGAEQPVSTKAGAGGLMEEKWLSGAAGADGQVADPKTAEQESPAKAPVHPHLQERSSISLLLMRDLKAQLLVLQSYLSETAGPALPSERETAFLQRQVQKLLTHVEQQQDRIVQRADDGNPFQVVAHWVTLEEQTRPVKFKVYYPRRNKSGQNGQYHRVALLLDMDRLGPVRVDLASLDKHLRIDFYVEQEESRTQIEQHRDKIVNILQPNFSEVHLTVRVSREKIARFDSEDQGPAGMGRIDIKA